MVDYMPWWNDRCLERRYPSRHVVQSGIEWRLRFPDLRHEAFESHLLLSGFSTNRATFSVQPAAWEGW